jgi:hypothetical protein
MNDNEVLAMVRTAQPTLDMDRPVETIIARGRARQARRRTGLVAGGVTLIAAVVVGVAGLTGSSGSGSSGGTPSPPGVRQVQLAAFTVVKNPNGTATVTFPVVQGTTLIDPNALRQALAHAGVPAIVTVGRTCSNTVGSAAELHSVVQVLPPSGHSGPSSQTISVIITPSAMPAGTELSIGIYPQQRSWQLANANAPLTCTSTPPSAR